MASHLDTVVVLFNKCQVNLAEIFQESGEFCLHWEHWFLGYPIPGFHM
jgi:hypothetical protein